VLLRRSGISVPASVLSRFFSPGGQKLSPGGGRAKV